MSLSASPAHDRRCAARQGMVVPSQGRLVRTTYHPHPDTVSLASPPPRAYRTTVDAKRRFHASRAGRTSASGTDTRKTTIARRSRRDRRSSETRGEPLLCARTTASGEKQSPPTSIPGRVRYARRRRGRPRRDRRQGPGALRAREQGQQSDPRLKPISCAVGMLWSVEQKFCDEGMCDRGHGTGRLKIGLFGQTETPLGCTISMLWAWRTVRLDLMASASLDSYFGL